MTKSSGKKDTIWNFIKPFHFVLKAFGLGVFTIVGDISNGKIKTRISDVLYTMFWVSIQVYVIYVNVSMDLSLSRTNSFLIDRGAHLVEIFNACNVFGGTCFYALYRKEIWKIFHICSKFDEEVF